MTEEQWNLLVQMLTEARLIALLVPNSANGIVAVIEDHLRELLVFDTEYPIIDFWLDSE